MANAENMLSYDRDGIRHALLPSQCKHLCWGPHHCSAGMPLPLNKDGANLPDSRKHAKPRHRVSGPVHVSRTGFPAWNVKATVFSLRRCICLYGEENVLSQVLPLSSELDKDQTDTGSSKISASPSSETFISSHNFFLPRTSLLPKGENWILTNALLDSRFHVTTAWKATLKFVLLRTTLKSSALVSQTVTPLLMSPCPQILA